MLRIFDTIADLFRIVWRYVWGIMIGIWRLGQGMMITMRNFLRRKVTEQYPENRKTKVYPERMRGHLAMPHTDDNHHRCTACGLCTMQCPNGTIKVFAHAETGEDGRSRKVLDRYEYDLGRCTFCGLCVNTCPQRAITWSGEFENSVFNRTVLVEQLNREGSSLCL